jgi:site-specific recombinase XerD
MTDDSQASGLRPKLLDRVRQAIRLRHYSRRTEQAYVAWIRRFIVLNGKRHPRELGEHEVTAFLSGLAARGMSASTQNQALSAILFLYDVVIGERLAWMNGIVRAQRPVRLPVVLSREEVSSLLSRLHGPVWLMASLMYGAGLRLLECAELRVKDINFDRGELTIRDGKGGKDRVTMLPASLKDPFIEHLKRVKDAARCGSRGRARERRVTRRSSGTPAPRVNGRGNGYFPRPVSTWTSQPASGAAIICTNPCSSGR